VATDVPHRRCANDPEICFGIITKNAGKQGVSHAVLRGRFAGSPQLHHFATINKMVFPASEIGSNKEN